MFNSANKIHRMNSNGVKITARAINKLCVEPKHCTSVFAQSSPVVHVKGERRD